MQLSTKLAVVLLQAVSVYGQALPAYCSQSPSYDFSAYEIPVAGTLMASVPVTVVDIGGQGNGSPVGSITFDGQTLPVNFDTGSATDWVLGPFAEASPISKPPTQVYTPRASQTTTAGYFCSTYSASTAFGPIYSSNFTVGGTTFPPTTLGVANFTSPGFFSSSTPFSGIFGLGPAGNSKYMPLQPSWLFRNIRNFKSKVMGAALKAGTGGAFDFGFINAAKYIPPLQYTTPTYNYTSKFWSFQSNGIKLDNGTVVTSPSFTAIDSGNPKTYLNRASFLAYASRVPNATLVPSVGAPPAGFFFPCTETLPDLQVEIGSGRYITVSGSFLKLTTQSSSGPVCSGQISPTDSFDFPFQIIGIAVYQSNYIVHDLQSLSIGFARQSGF